MTLADSYAKLSPVMGVGGSNPSGRAMSSRKKHFHVKVILQLNERLI